MRTTLSAFLSATVAALTFFITLLFPAGTGRAAAATPDFEAAGPYVAKIIDLRWTDPVRQRELPLRLRLPDAPGPRPAILFSHGLGGSVDGGRAWGEHWASHGFIVIHLQHPGSDETVWKGAAQPRRAIRAAAGVEQFAERVRDVKFVLDEVARRHADGDALAARIALDRIGMSGHSFGAITTQAIAGQDFGARSRGFGIADPRPRAFIAFSPSARSEHAVTQFATIERPFLCVTGTEDGEVGLGLGVPPSQRLLPFAGMPPGNKYLLNLDGADHMLFNGGSRRRANGADPARDALHVRVTKATTTAFWFATLADDRGAGVWLASAAAYVAAAGAGEWRAK